MEQLNVSSVTEKVASTVSVKHRLDILDLARGVGFLLVLFRHSLGFVGATLLVRVMPQDAPILDFFFIMSGFFAGYAHDAKLRSARTSIRQAVLDRLVRVYPMVMLGVLLGVAAIFVHMLLNSDFSGMPFIASTVWKNGLLIPAVARPLDVIGPDSLFPLDVPLWFLLFDCIAYAIYLLILRYLPLPALVALAAMGAVGFWLAAIAHNNVAFGPVWQDIPSTIPRVLYGFTMGYILFRLYRPGAIKISGNLALAPIALLVAVIFLPVSATWAHSGELQALISTLVMPAIILFGAHAQASAKLTTLAKQASRLSLAVYVLHFPILRALAELRWRYHLHGADGLIIFLTGLLLPLLAAYVATKYYDEPIRALLLAKMRRLALHRYPNSLTSANG